MVRPTRKRALRPPRRASRAGRRRQGFTLMELMVVVALIMITAAIAAPAVHSAMAERRHGEAAGQLVLVARRARAEAAAYGRAHLIRFDSSGDGSFFVFRGTSSSCNANDWNGVIIPAGLCGDPGSMCVDELSLSDTAFTLGAMQVQAVESAGRTNVDLCYEPTGSLEWRVGTTGRFRDLNTFGGVDLQGGFRFDFVRLEGGTPAGVTRTVVVPLGGDVRVLR